MLTLWAITVRGLGCAKDAKHEFTMHVATKSSIGEKDAVREAKERYSSDWWEEHIITGVEYVGKLYAAEGLAVPQEESYY